MKRKPAKMKNACVLEADSKGKRMYLMA